jgi:hypothetical protein
MWHLRAHALVDVAAASETARRLDAAIAATCARVCDLAPETARFLPLAGLRQLAVRLPADRLAVARTVSAALATFAASRPQFERIRADLAALTDDAALACAAGLGGAPTDGDRARPWARALVARAREELLASVSSGTLRARLRSVNGRPLALLPRQLICDGDFRDAVRLALGPPGARLLACTLCRCRDPATVTDHALVCRAHGFSQRHSEVQAAFHYAVAAAGFTSIAENPPCPRVAFPGAFADLACAVEPDFHFVLDFTVAAPQSKAALRRRSADVDGAAANAAAAAKRAAYHASTGVHAVAFEAYGHASAAARACIAALAQAAARAGRVTAARFSGALHTEVTWALLRANLATFRRWSDLAGLLSSTVLRDDGTPVVARSVAAVASRVPSVT